MAAAGIETRIYLTPLVQEFFQLYEPIPGPKPPVLVSAFTSDDDRNIEIISTLIHQAATHFNTSGLTPPPQWNPLYRWFKEKGASDTLTCKEPIRNNTTTFADVRGSVKEKNQMIINYVMPFRYPLLFQEVPKGILLYGPPGTGKTFLVRAATGELKNVAFYAPTPGDLRGKYEGETEKNIRDVFLCAKKTLKSSSSIPDGYRAAVIFIDELDSIGGKRGDDAGMTRSVNALLQSMDGVEQLASVSTIGATNFPWSLDTAVLRRFSSRVFIDLPSPETINFIIRDFIGKNYGDPWNTLMKKICSAGRRPTVDKELLFRQAKDLIVEFGSTATTVTSGGWFGGGQTVYQNLCAGDNLERLVALFGVKPIGVAIQKQIFETKTPVDVTDPRLNERLFGYSPSDITNILTLAMQKSSQRAAMGNVTRINLPSLSIPSSGGRVQEKTFFVSVLEETGDDVYAVRDLLGETTIEVDEPTARCRGERTATVPVSNLVVTFDLRWSDVEEAMKEYPPTIDSRDYVKLAMYSVGLYAEE